MWLYETSSKINISIFFQKYNQNNFELISWFYRMILKETKNVIARENYAVDDS